MALETFVPDGGITRFSVNVFINGCMNDSESDGYDTLEAACDYAKELAQGDYFAVESDLPGGVKYSPDVIVTGPDGTEYVTRWLTTRVDEEGDEEGLTYLVTVEAYDLEEDTNGRFQVIVPITYEVAVRLDAEDRYQAQENALAIVKAMDTETLFERCGFGKTVEEHADGATFGDPIVSDDLVAQFSAHMDHLDEVYGRDTRHLAEGSAS